MGGVPGDRNVSFIVAANKEVTESNAPAGAALIAQAMDQRECTGRYKAVQSIMDWDNSRLAYRAVKRAFDKEQQSPTSPQGRDRPRTRGNH